MCFSSKIRKRKNNQKNSCTGIGYGLRSSRNPTTPMTIYQELIKAGLKCSSHYSDLYVRVTEQSRNILKNHPIDNKNATIFRSNLDGKFYYDIPFAYDPFWEKQQQNHQELATI